MASRALFLLASLPLVGAADYSGPATMCNTPCMQFAYRPSDGLKGCDIKTWQVCMHESLDHEVAGCPAKGADQYWTGGLICHTVKAGQTFGFNVEKKGLGCTGTSLDKKSVSPLDARCTASFTCCPSDAVDTTCAGPIRTRNIGGMCRWEFTAPPDNCACDQKPATLKPQLPPSGVDATCRTKCLSMSVKPVPGSPANGCGVKEWNFCYAYKYDDQETGCPVRGTPGFPEGEHCTKGQAGSTEAIEFFSGGRPCVDSVAYNPITANGLVGKCVASSACCPVDEMHTQCSGHLRQVGDRCRWEVTLPRENCGCANPPKPPQTQSPLEACQSPCLDISVQRIGDTCPARWNVCYEFKYADQIAGCPAKGDPKFVPGKHCAEAQGATHQFTFFAPGGGCHGEVASKAIDTSGGQITCKASKSCCSKVHGGACGAEGDYCEWTVALPTAECACKWTSKSTTAATTTNSLSTTTKKQGGQESLPKNIKKASADPFASVASAEAADAASSRTPSLSSTTLVALSVCASAAVALGLRRRGLSAEPRGDEQVTLREVAQD